MNAPPRFVSFTLPDGVKKLTMEKDQKIENAASFIIQCEDHTLGNILAMQLVRNPAILFAGYKQPHPLEHYIIVRVQPMKPVTPGQALEKSILELHKEFSVLENEFREALNKFRGDDLAV